MMVSLLPPQGIPTDVLCGGARVRGGRLMFAVVIAYLPRGRNRCSHGNRFIASTSGTGNRHLISIRNSSCPLSIRVHLVSAPPTPTSWKEVSTAVRGLGSLIPTRCRAQRLCVNRNPPAAVPAAVPARLLPFLSP